MKILWVGPFFSDRALLEKRAPNQAAAEWSRGLLQSLEACGCEIRVVSHCPECRWPKGRVFWQSADSKWFLDWYPCERVGYLNVLGLKSLSLTAAYRRGVRKVLSCWRPDVVLAYNVTEACNIIALEVAHRAGVRCVPIILDGDDPRRDSWRWLLNGTRCADGVVFLSWWMYQNYPRQNLPIFHMDGGADEFKGLRPSARQQLTPNCNYTLVHMGSLDCWRGLRFMQRVVKTCKRKDVRFVFCGKCDKKVMWAEFGNDPRVEVKGFVSEREVDTICQAADVFLNVREPEVGDNILNYPSKVPRYLAYGKPVVSTWIDSFSPDYRAVLDVCDNTPDGFVQVLDEVLKRNSAQRAEKFEQIKTWFLERKSWSKQAARLVVFLEGLK